MEDTAQSPTPSFPISFPRASSQERDAPSLPWVSTYLSVTVPTTLEARVVHKPFSLHDSWVGRAAFLPIFVFALLGTLPDA